MHGIYYNATIAAYVTLYLRLGKDEVGSSNLPSSSKMNDPTQSEQVDETCRSGRVILCLKSLGITAFLKISCQNGYETLKFKPLQTEVENIKVRRFEHRCLIWRFY